jgi:hypothetical protein
MAATMALSVCCGSSGSNGPTDSGQRDGGQVDGGSRDGGGSSSVAEPAISSSSLAIAVIDAVSEQAVTASLQVGAFALTGAGLVVAVPTGRLAVTATALGFVPWRRELAIGASNGVLKIDLLPRAPAQSVSTAGGTVTAGTALLEFQSGTFSSPTAVSATLLDRARVASGFGSVQFVADERVHRVVQGISVLADAQPATPVSLRFAIGGSSARGLTLWLLSDSGAFVEPRAPVAESPGEVTFVVDHFSEYGLTEDYDMDADVEPIIVEVQGEPEVRPPNGPPVQAVVGDTIPVGSRLHTDGGSTISLQAANGSTVSMPPDGDITVNRCVDMTMCSPQAPDVTINSGRFRATVPPLRGDNPPRKKFMIRTRALTNGGVRGTVFEVASTACPTVNRTIDDFAVYEGVVEVVPASGEARIIEAGFSAALCDGCPPQGEVTCEPCLDSELQAFSLTSYTVSGSIVYGDQLISCADAAQFLESACGSTLELSHGGATFNGQTAPHVIFNRRTCAGWRVVGDSSATYTWAYVLYRRAAESRTLEFNCRFSGAFAGACVLHGVAHSQ